MAKDIAMPPHIKPGAAKPEQVAAVLEHEIRTGMVGFGDRLQSENELVQRFAVSRNTVRRGLEGLSKRGLITTRVGIGSFVTFKGQTIDDAVGWSRALAEVGADVETRTLRFEIIDDGDLAEQLGVADTAFIAIDRIRRLVDSQQAISIERSRLPMSSQLESLPLRGLREGSLRQTLRAAGLIPHHGEEWAGIERLGAEDAKILGHAPETAFLRTRRLTRTADERPIEHVTSLLDPAYFALHLEF